jgi:tungstate transport system substrate-binding protein
MGATTTTENSGFLDYILPKFTAGTGIEVRVIVQGTGAILSLGEAGDIDMMLVHSPRAEQQFIDAGFGELRRHVMSSQFLIVGPSGDPAAIRGSADPSIALRQIADAKAVYVSRGDDSGTHIAELGLWADVGLAPHEERTDWFRETGAGMGATLNTAVALGAYALTESATWADFGNRGDLEILVSGSDPRLVNPYSVIVVNEQLHSHIQAAESRKFVEWLTGADGQRAISEFSISGEFPFQPAVPNVGG